MLEIENLTVSIEGKELLKDISLSIAEGETRMLFGENGSGKTSLIMAIMGLGPYRVESGRILFKGEDITRLPANERASSCLLYTSDAADDLLCVDLGGRRIIK